ncbi:MAG: type II toxin-antitoxin system YoeB family toxin, partial [Actinobacteria bacterium]|nr:type II toxin-antitoxin system YoeB family toxin [Actinomycetota bacterium]
MLTGKRPTQKSFKRSMPLCGSILTDPQSGIGKPEKLKYELSGS